MQPLAEVPLRQVPVVLEPGCPPLAGSLPLLACGTPHDAGHTGPSWPPEARASPKGEAPRLAWMKTAEPSQMGLLRRYLKMEFCQPLGPHPTAPFRVRLEAEGPHPVISLSAPPCVAPAAWLHHWFKPQVEGVVQIHICKDG